MHAKRKYRPMTSFPQKLQQTPSNPQVRGRKAPEILPEIDVAEIATAVYDLSLIHI